jgi:hypothetical protein
MHIPNTSLRTLQFLPEQLAPETRVYVGVQAAIAAGRRFEAEHGRTLLARLRTDRHHAALRSVEPALVLLRDRLALGPDDPVRPLAVALRLCPEDEETLLAAGERVIAAIHEARDALAAWRTVQESGRRCPNASPSAA